MEGTRDDDPAEVRDSPDRPGREAPKPRKPEPVFAPEVPADVRKLLTDRAGAMVRADRQAVKPRFPFPPGIAGRILAWVASGLVVATVLAAVLERNEWALPDGASGWLGAAARLGVALVVGQTILEFHERWSAARAAFEYHGRYLKAKDWDSDAKKLMRRAQRAVREVQSAEVTKQGLLDDIRNDVVLPEQLWDIGQVLQQLSVLRTRHRKLSAEPPEALADALGSQAAALRVAEEAMERKVAMLEAYAGQVQEADAVLKAEIVLREALQDRDKYIELLARTESAARTELIGDLTEEAAELRERLTQSIEAVRETSHTLALPGDDDPPSRH